MIKVTRLNGTQFYVNADLIRYVESTPDTVVTMVDDVKIIVKEPAELVIEKILQYRQKVENPVWEGNK